jgi:hypothetical protein
VTEREHLVVPRLLGLPALIEHTVERDDERSAVAAVLAVHVHGAVVGVGRLAQDLAQELVVGAEHPVEGKLEHAHPERLCGPSLATPQAPVLPPQVDDRVDAERTHACEVGRVRLAAAVDRVGDLAEVHGALGEKLLERIGGRESSRRRLGQHGRELLGRATREIRHEGGQERKANGRAREGERSACHLVRTGLSRDRARARGGVKIYPSSPVKLPAYVLTIRKSAGCGAGIRMKPTRVGALRPRSMRQSGTQRSDPSQ